jgi:undecaprenyl-diphosphatase
MPGFFVLVTTARRLRKIETRQAIRLVRPPGQWKAAEMLWRTVRQTLAWFSGREPVVLLSMFLVVGGIWAFIEIADEVAEGEFQKIDEWAVRALRKADNPAEPIGPRWLQEMGRDATALGGVAWLVFFTFAVAGYLWLDKKTHMSVFLLGAAASGTLVGFALKSVFARPRPDVVPHLAYVTTHSFPSGHSMLSAVVYITLGTLLAAVVARRRLKVYILSIAIVLPLIVGISRVYLGVHYPTDVLAGWMAGLAWALLCWLVARWLQRRGEVESEPPERLVDQRP